MKEVYETRLKEILEISQHLLKNGFEPDMWTGDYCYKSTMFTSIKDKRFTTGHGEYETFNQPFMTLNRALELLPRVIRVDNRKYDIEMFDNSDGFTFWYTNGYILLQEDEHDPHLAALRLLKQVVEKGYLKNG